MQGDDAGPVLSTMIGDRGDIEPLANYFLEYYNRKYNCKARPLSPELMEVLQKYHWPGNIASWKTR